MFFYVLDILVLDGEPTNELPYRRRRELVDERRGGDVVLAELQLGKQLAPADVLAVAAQHALKGVVTKADDSRYRPGERSREWIKTALRARADVRVGGWLPGEVLGLSAFCCSMFGGTGRDDAAREAFLPLVRRLARADGC